MILHLHGQALYTRFRRYAFRHRPTLEHAVFLKPKVEVVGTGEMLLDYEMEGMRVPDSSWQVIFGHRRCTTLSTVLLLLGGLIVEDASFAARMNGFPQLNKSDIQVLTESAKPPKVPE
jgi:hypothetical protein